MYSDEISQILEEKGLQLGDRIKVTDSDTTYEGLLMPRENSGNPNYLVLKLDDGYNVGVKLEEDTSIELVRKKSERDTSSEKEAEKADKDELKSNEDLPTISLLHTGGTIASKVVYGEGGVKAAFSPEEITDLYPEMLEVADLRSEKVLEVMSENMNFDHYQQIAQAVKREIEQGTEGIIISHGTDTMHYTAAALSFMFKGLSVPVLLVGSQRSSDRPSSDAGMNLLCAAQFIVNTDFAGVGLCMHGSTSDDYCLIHEGTKARKMHTSRRDAFQSINQFPYAKVNYKGEIEFLRDDYDRRDDQTELKLCDKFAEQVALVKTYPEFDSDVIDYYRQQGYKGLVIEGTGLGHAPVGEGTDTEQEIEKFSEQGIVVVTSQCLHGRVNLNVYQNQRLLKVAGAVAGEDMLPAVAYIKLAWLLGNYSVEEARKLINKDLKGEITNRTDYYS